jgi:hypothetical protein
MSDAWGGHQAAVFVAIERVGEMQEHLAILADLCDSTLGAIAEATEQARVESAANARDFAAGVQERITEAYGMTQQAVAELQRYAGGF